MTLVERFTYEGSQIVSRTGQPVDVSSLLTCTAAGEQPDRELCLLWGAYALVDDSELADDAKAAKASHKHESPIV